MSPSAGGGLAAELLLSTKKGAPSATGLVSSLVGKRIVFCIHVCKGKHFI